MITTPFSLSDDELKVLSFDVRKSVFEICLNAHNGHIGGSSGAVEMLVTLYFGGVLKYNPTDPADEDRDRVLIRGHLGPLRYKIFSLIGFIEEVELLDYRQFGSRLQGHEDHLATPGVDITPSGSLGMILSYGVGCALSLRKAERSPLTYVFLGDGEEQEGNVSEAARHASHLRLGNLIVLIDKNAKQLSDPVNQTDSSDLAMIWKGYGWNVISVINGHDVVELRTAFRFAQTLSSSVGKPTLIITETVKGCGLDLAVDHFSGYHTISTCTEQIVTSGIRDLDEIISREENKSLLAGVKKQLIRKEKSVLKKGVIEEFKPLELSFKPLQSTSSNPDGCQIDYFQMLAAFSADRGGEMPVFFLTADVTRQDHVDMLGLRKFCTFLNTGIREQHTVAMAHGLSVTQPNARILINSLDAFTYRSIDQLNAAVHGNGNMLVIADVSGLTNSKNGKTHQTSGQPGALLLMPGVTFLEPWDTEDTFNCLNWAIGKSRGVVYMRVHSSDISRRETGSIVRSIDWYPVREPDHPDATIVASGLMVESSLEAAKLLEASGIKIKVINVINHKSLESSFASAVVPNKPLLTVYNGVVTVLQANVAKVLMESGRVLPTKVVGLGFDFGTTGALEDLMKHYGLDAVGISSAMRKVLVG